MSLDGSDLDLVTAELDRSPTPVESALFENLWSEHCAYRSSRPLLASFDSSGDHVVVGPGDDAAVVRVTDELFVTIGIESHNHPSYVDPYDGAATGVGGIVRDTLSMGAYPIALADCLYFGSFADDHPRYLFEGVVEGIADYGNAIGVPTVAGSVDFHPGFAGNPLVNVGCIGLVTPDRVVTAAATTPGNRLVLVGNATGRDGLGGASFASEDLGAEAETEDRPAVQVGDPYAEKLLIEANEALLDEGLVDAARDLGAAGLGGATSEMAAKGGVGADIALDRVHQREPDMTALEILLAESQERMCYSVRPDDVDRVRSIAERFDLGCSVVGELTEGQYVCTFEGEVVVDVPASLLADGAPAYERPTTDRSEPAIDLPDVELDAALDAVLADPNTASKRWVYRQYDHEVGARTAMRPGADAAVLALREAGVGLAVAAGSDPRWTATDPYDGARAVALEVATNVAVVGACPHAAVDCLNGGNPETPEVFGGFAGIVDGLADMCRELDVPVVGGNVSLYNDSTTGPVPPTPTLLMIGIAEGYRAPSSAFTGAGSIVLVGAPGSSLGGSVFLANAGGSDRFPALPPARKRFVDRLAEAADREAVEAVHDVSHGGLAVTLAEMVSERAGATVTLPGPGAPANRLFGEAPGRVVVETTDPDGIASVFEGIAPVHELGRATDDPTLALEVDGRGFTRSADELRRLRDPLARELD